MTRKAPKSFRLHIALFGRRNVGKSSLLNALTGQEVSIVSDTAGTTTDPVEKPMELLPLGPVLFIDTAGLDDAGALGELRVTKSRRVFDRTDPGVIVSDGQWGKFEETLLDQLADNQIPALVVLNLSDIHKNENLKQELTSRGLRVVETAAINGTGIDELKRALVAEAPADFLEQPVIIADLVGSDEMAVLVVPIDKEAPKGRLINPQVQVIRELLDADAMSLVVKERELQSAMERLRRPPKLVVTDSQAFLKVAADVPSEIPMTSFSILYSRFRGDLTSQALGAVAVNRLKPGDRVMIAEACTHHPIGEDIGRVKIPRWIEQYVGGKLEFDVVSGHDFPEDVSDYSFVIHCGACTFNRREMLGRIVRCRQQGVPITNYGLVIAFSLGLFERALKPFPAVLEAVQEAMREGGSTLMNGVDLDLNRIREWLTTGEEEIVSELLKAADRIRSETVGDEVHLRGLVEISNRCMRSCLYCGLRSENSRIPRYRMQPYEVVKAARKAKTFGYGTVVLQSGEDYGWSSSKIETLIRHLKEETELAITLLGERSLDEYSSWKKAGADRVLIRFETSDRKLLSKVHPAIKDDEEIRFKLLAELKSMGYEVGSGVMVGLPGQTADVLARDIQLFSELDLDMVGWDLSFPTPETPLGWIREPQVSGQMPATIEQTLRVIAMTRLTLPWAHIPSTSAIAALDPELGHSRALSAGANVIMPNLTPLRYRSNYAIYPGKAFADEAEESVHHVLMSRISSLGRRPGVGAGGKLTQRA